jgi:hypothetical protein
VPPWAYRGSYGMSASFFFLINYLCMHLCMHAPGLPDAGARFRNAWCMVTRSVLTFGNVVFSQARTRGASRFENHGRRTGVW